MHGRIDPAKLTIPDREMSLPSTTQPFQTLQLALNEIQFLKMELRNSRNTIERYEREIREKDQAFQIFMTKFEKLEGEFKSLSLLIESLKIPLTRAANSEVFDYVEFEKFVPSDPKARNRVMSDQRDISDTRKMKGLRLGD